MIFAAGLGTRMGDLVKDQPKPMVPVAGKRLIDHAIEIGQSANVSPIVVNAHYKADVLKTHLKGAQVIISDETDLLLDTGGGLKNAAPYFDDQVVFTLNSDAVWTGQNPLQTLAAAWNPKTMDALLLVIPAHQATGHRGTGDFDLNGTTLVRGGPFTYTGAQIINRRLLDQIDLTVFSLNEAWNVAASNGRLHGVMHSGSWCDVGHPTGITEAEQMLGTSHGH